ncbi:hypothetical protein [Dyadobacter fermentans]|uniref:Ig-like domain-containing protein n=1 Tax=Dyadobacter fermentans (strain ATCC 700827 / DSM 18053 / CIP 107007 / KCTC 52180 / NS114) TaxID=471854 RepID=C6W0L9_DYAFD|nr:hypothetical protein [Dyadobacter fermentans]ACT93625.1 hypothetical protein Dfer_2407 [Dyadobacter fermentans DSM 18053]
MKSILSCLIGALLLCSVAIHAQQFSPTTGVPCPNCVPTNYNAIGTPFISDIYNPGIDVTKLDYQWYIYMGVLDVPPSTYSQGLPDGAGKNSFVSLKTSEGAVNDKLYVDVSGFDVNKTYVFRYSVCAANVYDGGNTDEIIYAESAKMEIVTVGQNPDILVKSQTTDFPDAQSQQHWTTRVISFKPLSPTLRFRMSGKTPGSTPGYVHFSIDKYPFDCTPSAQVSIGTPSPINTPFPSDKLNLNAVTINSTPPQNYELVWKSGPNSTDPSLTPEEVAKAPISNATATLKPYYAFYYAKDLNCYNVPTSTAEMKFMHQPTHVSLKATNVTISCPATTTDLTLLENPGMQVRWYNNDTHSGLSVPDPKAAPPGDYYAFYYDFLEGTWSLLPGQATTSKVHVENAVNAGIPNLGPTMSINSLTFAPNASRDFVVRIHNIKAEDSNCSVYFMVSKMPGFTISYNPGAGQSDVDGGIFNNNDFWTFTEDNGFIKVTSKYGIAANGYSDIGFKVTRNSGTPANTTQSVSIIIPAAGGGGEQITTNNTIITSLSSGIN